MTSRNKIYLYTKNDTKTLAKKRIIQRLLIEQYGFKVVEDHRRMLSIIVSIGSDGSFLQAVRKTGFRQDCSLRRNFYNWFFEHVL